MAISLEQQFNNLLSPFGSFSSWSNGPNSAPDGWEVLGAGATIAQDTINVEYSPFSASLTRGTADCRLRRLTGGINYYRGRTFSFGAWVRATVANRARIAIGDNTGDSYSAYHSGSSNWEFLTVIREFGGGAINFNVSLVIESGSTTAQINTAILVEGDLVRAFVRGNGEIILPIVLRNPDSAPNDVEWVWKYLNNTYTQGEPCFVLRSNQQGLGNNLRVVITRYGHMALWPVEGPEARPIPKSPYDPSKINALSIDGDVVFGDHLVRATTVITNFRRLPLALPYATLNAAITATDTTISVTQGAPQLPTDFPYRAVIWNGLNTTSAEIVTVNSLTSITRAQDGTTAVPHNAGDRVTRALNIQQDDAITNLLSGAERGSDDFFGGAGIAMQPIGRTDEANGSVFLDAFGRGTDKDSNCIFFRTRDVNSQMSTERARITSDGSTEHYVDDTKDCLYHRRMFRFNDITNSAWTTIATISPSTVTNVHRRGYVKAVVSAQRDTVGGGHLRISQWEFNINNAAPVPAVIVADTTVGTPGSIPNFQLVASGNNILAQVQGGSANNSDGTAFLEIYLPYDASGATWSIT